MKIRMIFVGLLIFAAAGSGWTTEEDKNEEDLQFGALLIQGEVQRPDIAIVTGDPGNDLDGLLRLRNDFNDLMAADAGEEIK